MSETQTGTPAITFEMRCNRSIEGEQQVNDADQNNALVTKATREFTLVSTDETSKPFESHVQHATMSATLLFPQGFDATAFERVRRGRRVRVTLEVVDDQPTADEITGAAGS